MNKMNLSSLYRLLIIILTLNSIVIYGMDGTIIMKSGGKRRKGDIIIIGGSGQKDVEEEVKYETKYTHVPVPIYIPQKPQQPKKIVIKMPVQIKHVPMPYQVPVPVPQKMSYMPSPIQMPLPVKSIPFEEQYFQRMSVQSPKQYNYLPAQQIQPIEPIKAQVIDELQTVKGHQIMPTMEGGGSYDDWWP